jgi:Domain of unknown function (DUF4351)
LFLFIPVHVNRQCALIYTDDWEAYKTLLLGCQIVKHFSQRLSEAIQSQVEALPLERLEMLGEDLLDFTSLADLENWLAQ